MRRSAAVIVLLCLFILWLVLVAYLAGSPHETVDTSPVNVGIQVIPPEKNTFSLAETVQQVTNLHLDLPKSETTEKEIYYIQAEDVDDNGNAPSWIYHVRSPKGPSILILERARWTVIPWNEGHQYTPIDTSQILPFSDLLTENSELLTRLTNQKRQIELYNNTYYVTISGGGESRIYTFDATTGMPAP